MNAAIKKILFVALILAVYSGISVSNEISENRQAPGLDVKSIVLLGASYAKGLRLDDIRGYKLVNKGVAGETSFEMLDRFNMDVVTFNPEKVILWGFINDISNSDRNKVSAALERVKKSYKEMILLAQQNDIEPILVTEITRSPRPGIKEIISIWLGKLRKKTSYQDYINGHVMAINQWLKEYAEENGLTVLDFQSLLAEGGVMRNKAYAAEDGSHVSEKGYDLITEYLIRNL